MSASMMGLGINDGRNYGSPSYTGISPTSSSSSQSRYYQPVVPSPLHAEQRVGPIHIPRDMSPPSNSPLLHRRQLSSHESQTNVHSSPTHHTTAPHHPTSLERTAYSSYPTDPHHKELKRLPTRASPAETIQPPLSSSPRSREVRSPRSPPHSPPMDRPSKSVMLERLASSASPPRHLPRHISRHTSSGGSSPIIGTRPDLLQHDSYASLNEGGGESSQRNRPEGQASGVRSGSLLDDDDSLVFKMSELGNESGPFDSGMYNNQYQSSLYGSSKESPRPRLLIGPNSHFANPSSGTTGGGGEPMSRRASSGSGVAMATVVEQEEPNTASSNSSSSSAVDRRGGGGGGGGGGLGGPEAHMFRRDW